MDARTPGSGDDLTALPLDALRQLVYAQGADETDERWIRAAAELTRRERASSPGSRAADGPAESDGADPADHPAHSGRRADPPLVGLVGALRVDQLPERV
ncbi:hypothetical protein DZF92_16830, partial [Clavibacter michiganensis subsp. insidiosus]